MPITGGLLKFGGDEVFVGVQDWMPTIERLGFTSVIFDCDGTLVDSAEAHFLCMQEAAKAQGLRMKRQWYDQRRGLSRASLFSEFEHQAEGRFDAALAVADSIAAFTRNATAVSAIAETVRLLRQVRAAGLTVAVGTNAEAAIARRSLEIAGLKEEVSILVSIDDADLPKPSPAIFLLAARKLGAAPERTLVIEDSPQGIEAADRAGMASLLLRV